MRRDDYGFCEAAECYEPATTITEKGYRSCQEHAEGFYGVERKRPRHPLEGQTVMIVYLIEYGLTQRLSTPIKCF